ncbi:MAG: hypothetical protein SH856_15100 [Flavobacteriales bacterium]|nr:hypothetical protein [Flavobacteriales bacterium]
MITAFIKRMGYRSRINSENEKEEVAIAKWIQEGMNTEDVSKEGVRQIFKKNGVKL